MIRKNNIWHYSLLTGMLAYLNGGFMFAIPWDFSWSGAHKEELIYGKNMSSFNNVNKADSILLWRGTTDINCDATYKGISKVAVDGKPSWDQALVVGASVRSRIPRGVTDDLVKTTSTSTKIIDVLSADHAHSVSRHIVWIRSAYVDLDLGALMGLSFENKHRLKVGVFPYQLDPQGIVLGDAYAVAPSSGFLGEAEVNDVDQFAAGALLTHEIFKEKLKVDFYVALLQSKSSSLGDTNARVLGHLYGRESTSAREFGVFNYVFASKLIWQPLDKTPKGSLKIVPFGLYNHEMEQKIELLGDASSHLGTVGVAVDYDIANFEASFESAVNLGYQAVKGIDRNQIVFQNNDGAVTAYNNQVIVGSLANGKLLPYVPNSEDQNVVYASSQGAFNNGQLIGVTTDGSSMFNSSKRYRDPYKNTYKGWMALFDAGYWCCDRQLRFAVMTAIASGDKNPNGNVQDDEYQGFVGLQELYSGGRVKSAFFLGGAGKPRRLLSVATDDQVADRFLKDAPAVGGFTNLRMIGASLLWTSTCPRKRPFKINPNIVSFWEDRRNTPVRSYLGTEANLFISTNVFDSLELFGVFALFAPGSHYTDRKDKPALSSDDQETADIGDTTGFTAEVIPGISDNLAYSCNCGFKITF